MQNQPLPLSLPHRPLQSGSLGVHLTSGLQGPRELGHGLGVGTFEARERKWWEEVEGWSLCLSPP